MKRPIKVFKFGGAALKDVDAIKNVKDILQQFPDEALLIVVSASGKITDALEKVVAAHFEGEQQALELFNEIKKYHFELMGELFPQGHEIYALVNDIFVEVDWILEEPPQDSEDYLYDQIVSVGELVSSRIVGAYLTRESLPTHWLDARDVIRTDDLYREAWVQWQETGEQVRKTVLPMLGEKGFVITQGFIGSTKDNQTTTLGRAGSDFSAAIFSYCLDAESMTIWKDVPGMLTADPRYFADAVLLKELSYREAIEMTYYGASVIHLKTIKPLQSKKIPLYVKSFLEPKGEGTRISGDRQQDYPPMVAVERNQVYLQIATRDYSFVAEHHMRVLFQYIDELRLQVNLMQNSGISFNLCLNDAGQRVDRFVEAIESEFDVHLERALQLITLRHPTREALEKIKAGKEIVFEKQIPQTLQLVARDNQA